VSIADGDLCFRYQDSQNHRWHTMTLPAQELMRRFLPHVLPQGFHKVRYDGLWSPLHRPLRHQLQLWLARHAPRPTSHLPCTSESADHLRGSTPPAWPDVSALRPGPAGHDPPAPPPPEGATMSHRAPVWPPHAGIIGAAAPRNRGPLPPMCPPPANYRRQPASTSPCGRQIPPAIRLLTPLPTSMDHRHPPTISRMCFPSGAACLKIPYGVEPRFSSTTLLCRLRATKTFIR